MSHTSLSFLTWFVLRQDHRGSIAWVSEAFGAEWGFIDAVWSLVTSFLDNALYPLIIADFLGLSGLARWLFVYGCIAALSWAVFRGSAVRGEGGSACEANSTKEGARLLYDLDDPHVVSAQMRCGMPIHFFTQEI